MKNDIFALFWKISEMNAPKDQILSLEQMIRIHENRIEHELHGMSRTFEACISTHDPMLMTSVFEYMRYR